MRDQFFLRKSIENIIIAKYYTLKSKLICDKLYENIKAKIKQSSDLWNLWKRFKKIQVPTPYIWDEINLLSAALLLTEKWNKLVNSSHALLTVTRMDQLNKL